MKTILYANFRDCHVNRRLLTGARRFAVLRGLNLQIVPPGSAEDLGKIIEFWHPAGILYGASGDNEASELNAYRTIPTVLLDAQNVRGGSPDVCRICCDNEAAARAAARELFAPDIADYVFCGIRGHYAWTEIRAATFRELVALHGGRYHALWLDTKGLCDPSSLALLKRLPRPFGILAANDEVAAVLLGACAAVRLHVPRDVAVVSIDDDELVCEHTHPTLTSVRLDLEAAGFTAAEMLYGIMTGKPPSGKTATYRPAMVVHRASTRRTGCASAKVSEALEFIRANIQRPLSVSDVAASMGCSRRLAQLRFARALGKSVGRAIATVRIERAQYYLRQRGQPISEIAGLCGFSDESALRRLFRRTTGQSMRDWRRQVVT